MMISEGSGMQADSMAIKRMTPEYPRAEIVATMKPESMPMIFATIGVTDPPSRAGRSVAQKHNLRGLLLYVRARSLSLESIFASPGSRRRAQPAGRLF